MQRPTPRTSIILGVAVLLLLAGVATAWLVRRLPTAVPPAPDYAQDSAWLCRPGRADPCAAPTTATVFEPGGGSRVATYAPDPAAPVDCFYVYPTVSRVRAAYSPIAAEGQERGIARSQLARFTSVCRPFAPLYRQVTLAGLPALFRGDPRVTLAAPEADVLAAWRHYLAHDNHGRGIVLVGHSQGSRLLARLMAAEIDGTPLQAKLVMAIIPGANIDVPDDRGVGGTFKSIPLCHGAGQTGCVIAYSTYPADRLASDPTFGISKTPGMHDACVDPQALAGTAHLDADIPLPPDLRQKLGTDFADFPGLIASRCTSGRVSVLAVEVSKADRLGEPTAGLVDRLAQYRPAFGLHSLDINLASGTLVDLVRQAAASYAHH